MSEAALNESLTFLAAFTSAKTLKTGLTVTVDIYDEAGTEVVSDASATEQGTSGIYRYTHATADAIGVWSAVFSTTDASVDCKQVPAAIVVRGNNTTPAGNLPVVTVNCKTREDLMDYIEAYTSAENATPNRKLYSTLLTEALCDISERARIYKAVWDNAADGAITVDGNEVLLPSDLISIDRVEYDGSAAELAQFEEEELDADRPGWRDATGSPDAYCKLDAHRLLLSAAPSDATGKLTIRGRAYLPAFSDLPGDQNPLAFIPAGQQLMVAHYVIARLPIPAVAPINDSREAITMANQELQRRMSFREEHKALYEAALASLITSVDRKVSNQFTY